MQCPPAPARRLRQHTGRAAGRHARRRARLPCRRHIASNSRRPARHRSSATATAERAELIRPHGHHELVDLMLPADKRQAAIDSCTKTLELSDRNACDVELLCVG